MKDQKPQSAKLSINSSTDFLAGGGDMSVLMHDCDWASTPLGAIEGWPQSLRTAVSILVNSRYPMFIAWGPELVFLYNDGYRPILGTKHPAALGRPFAEIWHEIWADIGPLVDSALRGEATWSNDLGLFMERNGYLEEVYFTFSYSPVRDESGGVGGMFCACTETTEKVLSERRLRCLRDLMAVAVQINSLEEADRLCLDALRGYDADVAFALLYRLNDDGTAKLVGTAGIDAGAAAAPRSVKLENDVWPLSSVAEGAIETVEGLPARLSDGVPHSIWGDPVKAAVVLPISLRGRTNAAKALVLGVNPRRQLDDDYRDFFRLVASNVETAVANARAFDEERRRAEALVELDEVKTAFFSNVSHEFRTPLTLMMGPLGDVLADMADTRPAAERKQIELAYRNGQRLLKLVNSLLDFSRIEARRMDADFKPTDLAALTALLASSFESACERGGLALRVDCPPLPRPVRLDRDMWEKIVLNLLSNAFKFTQQGEIAVSVRPAGENVELTVADTGVGIPAEDLPHVFERFYRVTGARSRTHEGAGIGLALVQELVKLHGGSVRVQSIVDEGSIFTVSIPFGSEQEFGDRNAIAAATAASTSSTAIGAEPFVQEALRWLPVDAVDASDDDASLLAPRELVDGKGARSEPRERIIWADDNADMREYVRGLLSGRYDVEAVADGAAALAAAQAQPPGLVLADVMMPGLDGFALLRELRADSRTRDVPVILLSARAGEEAEVEGLHAGADDYLVKPFTARELLARIQAHLRMTRIRREAAGALRESEARYRLATQASRDIIWDWNIATGEVIWSDMLNTAFGYAPEEIPDHDDVAWVWWSGRIHPDDRERTEASREHALHGSAERWTEQYQFRRADGSYATVLDRGLIARRSNGRAFRMVGSMADITERRIADEQRDLLLDELNHRVKNTLATVQSITAQVLRGSSVAKGLRFAIESRLVALAKSHDLLTRENWRTAGLRDVVDQALEPFANKAGQDERFFITGEEVRLQPKAALALSMALHELATNAAKYGALSNDTGAVAVTWTVSDGRLRLQWKESGGPEVKPPAHKGFGSRLIERGLAHDLNGSAHLEYARDGVICRVEMPSIDGSLS